MDWIGRLNSCLNRLNIGGGRLELLHWAYDEHLPDNWPHRHTYFEICLVGRHGIGVFYEPGGEHIVTPGTVFVARPGVVHNISNKALPRMELYWLAVGWSADERTPKSDGERAMRAFVDSDMCVAYGHQNLLALWEALRQTASGTWAIGSVEQTAALVKALVLGVAQSLSPHERAEIPDDPTRPGRQAATLAIRYIADNMNRPLTLKEIATHANVSTRQLTRLFGTFTGTSPAQYIRVLRLDRASALLTRSELPIKELSHQVGFSDVQYFTRCFTAHFGVPPAAYRQGARSGRIIQRPGMLV
ncbi:MAG: AraC family transcriptional regulator [Fimbriimonas sp.]|nr:AraC family transcriptional regulator [Fimbriimonas sp.]